MSQPKRIQRRRVKGWRLPYGATCVTRPGRWGNPYATAEEFETMLGLIDEFNGVIESDTPEMERMLWIYDNAHLLRGFDLACWCSLDAECHADVLIEYANRHNTGKCDESPDDNEEESPDDHCPDCGVVIDPDIGCICSSCDACGESIGPGEWGFCEDCREDEGDWYE